MAGRFGGGRFPGRDRQPPKKYEDLSWHPKDKKSKKKTTTKTKATTKKPATTKVAPKKAAPKKTAPKKPAAKKAAAKKAAPTKKKPAAKKVSKKRQNDFLKTVNAGRVQKSLPPTSRGHSVPLATPPPRASVSPRGYASAPTSKRPSPKRPGPGRPPKRGKFHNVWSSGSSTSSTSHAGCDRAELAQIFVDTSKRSEAEPNYPAENNKNNGCNCTNCPLQYRGFPSSNRSTPSPRSSADSYYTARSHPSRSSAESYHTARTHVSTPSSAESYYTARTRQSSRNGAEPDMSGPREGRPAEPTPQQATQAPGIFARVRDLASAAVGTFGTPWS